MHVNSFHKFEDAYGTCLINIEKMSACRIDEATSRMLDQISERSAAPLLSEVKDVLRKLDLVVDQDPPRKETSETVPPVIHHMILFITQKCNFRCVYCFGGDGSYGSEEVMDRKTAQRAVDWLVEQVGGAAKLNISFFGGEPLLNWDMLKHVVGYAGKRASAAGKTVQFGLSTNASLLDDGKINFLVEHRVGVAVGFDGLKELQDTQRPFRNGKGSYDATIPRIRRLLEAIPEASGRAMLTGQADPAMVEKSLYNAGFSRVAVDVSSPSLFHSRKPSEELKQRFSRLLELGKSRTDQLLGSIKKRDTETVRKIWGADHVFAGKFLDAFVYNRKRYYPCPAGRTQVAVSCSGDVFPCFAFVGTKDYRIGSVFEGELDRDLYLASPLGSVEMCSACFAKYLCGGGCRYDHVAVSGSLFEPNGLRCDFIRGSVEALASLCSQLSPEDKGYLVKEGIIRGIPPVFDF